MFNLYAGYIIQNAGLDEAQAGIKITGRNINNLRYADNTTLMAEREEGLKSLLMKMKEKNAGLKLSIQKMKINGKSMVNRWETMETVTDFSFLDSKTTAAMKLRHLLLGSKAVTNLDSVLKSSRFFQ